MKPSMVQFYLDRAQECRLAAEGALLENVQKKHTDAEASWRAMADLVTLREKNG